MKKIIALVLAIAIVLGAGWFFLSSKGEQSVQQQIIGTYTDMYGQKIVFKDDNTLEVTNSDGETKLGLWKLTSEIEIELFISSKKYEDGAAKLPIVGKLKSIEVDFYQRALSAGMKSSTFQKKTSWGF